MGSCHFGDVRVIADKAYDSDPLRNRLRLRGIELICIRIRRTEFVRPRKMGGRCGVINVVGSSSAPMHDWAISAAWWCAATAQLKIYGRSCILPTS